MNLKTILGSILTSALVILTLTACSQKQDEPNKAEQTEASAIEEQSEQISPTQQSAIDSLDKPVLDDKNTDVAESVVNAPPDSNVKHQ